VLQNNSACTGWYNVADLVLSQDLDIVDEAEEDAHEKFLDAVAFCQETLSSIGLSRRWMLTAAKDEQSLELHLQGLGVTGTTLQHPHFAKDNIPTIQLARYTVAADCFDGKEAAGPVPKFLTSNPIEVEKQLKENPALAHGYCQALAGKLIVPEDLTSLEAMAYV
jgi:hypothetical protein